MKRSGFYDEVKSICCEREAFDEYEIEIRKIEWEHEWRGRRKRLYAYHHQQLFVINERFNLKWSKYKPDFQRNIGHLRKVVDILEAKLGNEKLSKKDVEVIALSKQKRVSTKVLPGLISKQNQSARNNTIYRIINVNKTMIFM